MEKNSQSGNKIKAQSISMPNGGGAIKGIGETFQPNAFSGTGSYSIPIPLTPARGFEPKLNLSYSSGGGNDVFGLGFSLSIPKISRKTDTGIPKYNGDDTYILADEGELTPKLIEKNGQWVPDEKIISDGGVSWHVLTFLPREQGSFSLIEHWDNPSGGESWWKVTSRSNVTVKYGRSEDARIADPEDDTRIFEWLIEESFDSKGNRILYHYKPEDGKNISSQIYEINRSFFARKYIERIRYGNYFSGGLPETEKFAFEVVFDYGEYNLTAPISNPYKPVFEWDERTDPYSTYRSGFEIRTFRLCRNILIFHRFEELGDKPCLAKALQFVHDETAIFSFLRAVTQTGYRINPDGSYTSQSLPPLEFGYSQFTPPQAPAFKLLTVNESNTIPGYLNRAHFQPIDLKGEGLPGMLFSNAETTLYYEPLGDGAYQFPSEPASFPITKNLQNPALSLQSLDSNGQLELVVNSPPMAGYFSQEFDGSWAAFRTFETIPTDLANPYAESSDLDGNGKADLLVFNNPDLVFYSSEGKKGYGASQRVPLQDEFPASVNYGEVELVTFADVFGDGLAHRVRIRDGSVEAWPCLGYGRFGKKVTLGNAPHFDPTTTISRIFLADVNGSGATDLVFAYADRVDVFLNHSGNSFADRPLTIYLPESFSDIDHIQFADILGEGTSVLVLTKAGPTMSHWYYNFCGEREVVVHGKKILKPALKPYLLTKIDNNLGAVTEIFYASSTKFYLEDKKAGRPWVTRLPFPVQVVEKTVTSDEISGSRLTSAYKYHDGYFDPVEREFRGFGFVESWDTESFEDYQKSVSNPAFPSDRLNKELYVPPVYTKTWHHTGAYFEDGVITKQYDNEYFQGDKDAYDFPDSVFDPAIFQSNPETVRQAYVALKGTVMRQEVYALDDSPEQANPYTVTESNVEVKLIQPMGNQQYAVFKVNPRESISYHYERNPNDPRVQQDFTLEVDPLCGETKKACTVFLPRRTGSSPVYPEQKQLKTTAIYNDYINTPDTESYRYRGVPYQTQEFEVFGLDLNGKHYFSFADVLPVKAALDNPLPYQAAPVPGELQAQQLTWNKSFFWNEDQTGALGPSLISSHALPHHNETAVFTKEFISEVFGQPLSDDTIQSYGGYFFDAKSGYWWNKGLTQFYLTASDAFYLPFKTENSFVDPSSSLFIKSTVEYDQPYNFSVIKATQYIDEANPDPDKRANTVTAQIDYITLQPYQLVDINGNVSQAIFDPLGQVIVSTLFGTEDGNPVGGMRLYSYDGKPAEYTGQSDASFSAILDDPHGAEKYLQGAISYFYYNLLAWKDQKQPPCSINLVRDDFYHLSQGTSDFACKTIINYSDGFGRTLEIKLKTDPGMAYIRDTKGRLALDPDNKPVEALTDDRWIASGRTVYNNKGKPCEQYLPYFSNTPLFETQEEIVDQKLVPPPTVTHYDPLLRIMRVDTPKGFFSKVEFTPWEEKHYDEDDTVIDSAYYIDFMANYPIYPAKPTQAQEDEKDALDKAAKFYNTPSISILDNAGNSIRTIENNLGSVSQDAFKDIVKDSATSEQLFNELVTKGYLVAYGTAPINAWVTDKFQPYTPGFVLDLDDLYKQFIEKVTDLLKQNCLTSFSVYDVQGRVVETIDPRLYYANQTTGTNYYNFKYRYAMGEKAPVYVDSVDAGVEKHQSNIFGNQLWSLSARNYCQLISYDRLQRRSAVRVKKLTNDLPITSYADFNLVEDFAYGETQPDSQKCNLRGQLYRLKDLSGIVINSQYNLLGKLLETSRQMATDYKVAIAWNSVPPPALEAEIYTSRFTYNALKLLITVMTPDNSITANSYNLVGQLNAVSVNYNDSTTQPIINNIEYDAKGERKKIKFGNGIVTNYIYEETTLRLTGLHSTKPNGTETEVVQDITYTYDPVGNITASEDKTYETVINENEQVKPLSSYTYNAIYQLIEASGRQHPDINKDTYKNNGADGDFKQSKFSKLPNINDADKLEMYHEFYSYDDSRNLISRAHNATSASWTRETPVEADSNRLEGLEYDAAGNLGQLDINKKVPLLFNCFENLIQAGTFERPGELDDCDYYMYDSRERRTRTVSERTTNGVSVSQIEEKIYLGNYEIKRIKGGDGKTTLEMQTLRVMDGYSCAAIIHHWIKGDGPNGMVREQRYQMVNDESSVSLEYDENAELLSYEEYFPYGGTAIIAGSDKEVVELKDYRYTGKECDDITGLYYYGARYYSPWLGRWLNPDPTGPHHNLNLYAYVTDDPTTYIDPTGDTRAQLIASFCATTVASWATQMNAAYALVSPATAAQMDTTASLMEAEVANSSADYKSATLSKFLNSWTPLHMLNFHHNPILKDLWTDSLAKVQNPETLAPKELYSKARGHFTGLITSQYPEFNYHAFTKPPEIHHATYKSLQPELAADPANLWLFTRGGKTSLGQHEMFHKISSAKAKSLYTVLPDKSRRALLRQRKSMKALGGVKKRKTLELRSRGQFTRRNKGAGAGKHTYTK